MKPRVVESVFLGGLPVCKSRDLTRALVLGGDWVGNEVANRLALEGLHVLLLGESEPTVSHRNIQHLRHFSLEEIRGCVGGFEAVLKSGDEISVERIGFAVAASPARVVPKFAEYGLSAATDVISLTDLENRLADGQVPATRKQQWAHVAFLTGLAGESHPAVFSRILWALERLASADNVQTYVFCRNLKVAEAGLERRYRESRERGTVYFRFDDQKIVCEQSPEGITLFFQDPVLREEMELRPDLLVVDEDLFPPTSVGPLLASIPSSPAFAPFLQPESLRFPGVKTPKAGFCAVGPSRGVYSPELIAADIETVVSSLKESLPALFGKDLGEPPLVDEARCVMCLTCVRLCPHGAMGFHLRPEADPESCVRCGICAAECPMHAITLAPRAGENDLDQKVRLGLAGEDVSSRIVAFLCSRSAMDALSNTGAEIKRHLVPVVVPCAGTVGVSHMLSAFRQGAAGVLVSGCFKGNCASIYGTALAGQRTAEIARILETAGILPGRVLFVPSASNNAAGLAWAVREFEESLNLVEITA